MKRIVQTFMFIVLVGLTVSSLSTVLTSPVVAQDWTEFRGPGGSGHAVADNLPTDWTDADFKWRIRVPGRGWSSPVLFENQIWFTTGLETKAEGADRDELLKSATMNGLDPYSRVQLVAICIDKESGSVLHKIELFDVDRPPLVHNLNSFASPTCVIDGDFVYCNFGTMGTACVKRDAGEVVWKNRGQQLDHETGPGSSPVIWNDLLIFHCDGTDVQFVVALDKNTGTEVWRQKRSGEMDPRGMMKKAFSTPTLVTNANGNDELISAGANWLYSYEPATGKELWKAAYGRLGFSNVPRPIVDDGMIYICTGFMRSTLLAYRMSGHDGAKPAEIAWSYEKQVPAMPSPILVEDLLFMVSDRGIATCLDAKTGAEKWQHRLGGEFSASPILADGKLFFGNRSGEVFVIEPSDKFKLIASNQLDSAVMATPAASGESIFVRTAKSLYCIRQKNDQ